MQMLQNLWVHEVYSLKDNQIDVGATGFVGTGVEAEGPVVVGVNGVLHGHVALAQQYEL